AEPEAATGPMRLAYALVVPPESVARTAKPSVWPTSLATSTYVALVAPWIDLQWAPDASHRYHWYAYVIERWPVHAPCVPLRCSPWSAVPVTVGAAVGVGAGGSTRAKLLSASCVWVPTVARTSATSVWPASSAVSA